MVFKSNSRIGERLENGSIFELKNNNLRIRIHHYVGCGDTWFLSCKALNISTEELHNEVFERAVVEAKEIIDEKIKSLREEANKFLMDNEIEISRY